MFRLPARPPSRPPWLPLSRPPPPGSGTIVTAAPPGVGMQPLHWFHHSLTLSGLFLQACMFSVPLPGHRSSLVRCLPLSHRIFPSCLGNASDRYRSPGEEMNLSLMKTEIGLASMYMPVRCMSWI